MMNLYARTQPSKKLKSMYGRPKTRSPFPSNCFDRDKKPTFVLLDTAIPSQGGKGVGMARLNMSEKLGDKLKRLNERGKYLKAEAECKSFLPAPQTQGKPFGYDIYEKEQENSSYKLTFYNPKLPNQQPTATQTKQGISFDGSLNTIFPCKFKQQIITMYSLASSSRNKGRAARERNLPACFTQGVHRLKKQHLRVKSSNLTKTIYNYE
eukprot:TRINITY_DN5477_c0_g1_i9.p1 TRINITY_DN5477_c0_g1~~TRINITY_DN5477_c0_g1_i9.p1  ORF type:complete len:209 (+),score=40.86 TRINITY_DN5477_c0_g1_i9:180-806(+)